MLPEIGHLALILALALALLQTVIPLAGAARGDARLMAVAQPAAAGQFGFLLLSFVCLALAFVNNDYTVAYVAANSNTQLPVWYRIAAVWGGHEGSLLLWALILGGWTMAVALFSRALPADLSARVIGVMGLVSFGFLLFLQLTSNPFQRLLPDFPLVGRDLNPLLQDIGLIIHPPMLYLGYVGFAVIFAFVVAALLGGRLDSAWARWARPWTVAAWCFLTLGIALGSWWAYYELGWGGWWFWDPVENASFMPWLVGTALIHSLAATEKRGVFRLWTALLAIAAFSLSLLGTFLVRSGVLTSVHAFANDPARGLFILGLLAVITGGALALVVIRAPTVRSEGRFAPVSRETGLLVNNLLLTGACGVVFTGTLFPLLMDVLDLGKLSVGPPYFNTLFVPLTLALLLALAPGSLLRWKRDDLRRTARPLAALLVLSLALGGGLPWWLTGEWRWLLAVTLSLTCWVVLTALYDAYGRFRRSSEFGVRSSEFGVRSSGFGVRGSGVGPGLAGLSRSYWGMTLAHLGLAVCVTGAAVTSAYSVERDVRLQAGEAVPVGPYGFKLLDLEEIDGPNYQATRARVEVHRRDGELETVLEPEKRLYTVSRMPMTEVAIYPGLFRELYLALGEPLPDGGWAVRIHYKPFVRWIWLGAVLMALGGVIAISDPRYRFVRRRRLASSATTLGETDVAPA